jgi:HPt (histidine-containing phosphotransfer) domain-containing protein
MSDHTTPTSDHRVNAVKDPSSINYVDFEYTPELPVIVEELTLEQCGDWAFVAELLEDFLNDRDESIEKLSAALKDNDHTEFHKTAHGIKGASLNLHLPALVDVSKKLEKLGKQLEVTPEDERLLTQRQSLIDGLLVEYENLENYLPQAKKHALEAEGQ